MWIVHVIIALIFLALGVVFMMGKGAFLIAGYNTSSKETKDKYDEKALCKFMGKIMFAYMGSFLLMATSDLFKSMVPMWIGFAIFFVISILAVVYANMGSRFRR
ncbi:MAG: DUF3784 domain-containing protein [Clostridiales bacterium]|nr:DUF3784 domain-containing protein [Clostridiales bacterium]